MAVITTTPLTILDLTDTRKLEAYITSNSPNVQIFDPNTTTYSPDWSVNNLVLTARAYLNSRDITDSAEFVWYTKDGVGTETQIVPSDVRDVNNNVLTIKTNELLMGISTYVCKVAYQGLNGYNEITFVLTQSGLNGQSGEDAHDVIAEYSINGTDDWLDTFDASMHKYIRFSYNNGVSWGMPIKIVGDDGTSVQIKGMAYVNQSLSQDDVGTELTLYTDTTFNTPIETIGLQHGDSYIVQGYLCVFSGTENKFTCVGLIQGPKGDSGVSSFLFIRYATDSMGSGMSTSWRNRQYIGTAITTQNVAPSNSSAYTWCRFVGQDAYSIVLNASSSVFKVDNNGIVSPDVVYIRTQTNVNSSLSWSYSTDGGRTFNPTPPVGVHRTGTNLFIYGANLQVDSVVIRASAITEISQIVNGFITIYKVFDGVNGVDGAQGESSSIVTLTNNNITFSANQNGEIKSTSFITNVVAQIGNNKVLPVIGSPIGLPDGLIYNGSTEIGDELMLSFSISDKSTLGNSSEVSGQIIIPVTYPYHTNLIFNWNKILSGLTIDDLADSVLEYGEINSWFYRKWNSGKLEQWTQLSGTTGGFTQAGAMYRSLNSLSGTFAIPFTIHNPIVSASISGDENTKLILETQGRSTLQQTPIYWGLTSTDFTAEQHSWFVDIMAVGSWK